MTSTGVDAGGALLPTVLLVLPTQTYRAAPFLAAARRIGLKVVVGSEEASSLLPFMRDRMVTLDLREPAQAADVAEAFAREHRIDTVVGVDETAVLTAAHVAARLRLRANSVDAVRHTRDKRLLRAALGADVVAQPTWLATTTDALDTGAVAQRVGYPCVAKPVDLAGSRGVIRADDGPALAAARDRIAAMLQADPACGEGPWPLLVEGFVPGEELALEGVLRHGELHTLALFDKPDPLDGPFFEETLYVTPSRLDGAAQTAVRRLVQAAVRALRLTDGPVHAEVRMGPHGPVVIEVAARSIGGLCSASLQFHDGATLEELILREAVGMPLPTLERSGPAAGGVLMLPTPAAGVLRAVHGVDEARAVPGVDGVTVSVPVGEQVVPLPEGARYLGFVFAHGATAGEVEASLRSARARLRADIGDVR